MKRFLLSLVLVVTFGISFGQIPNGYYNNADGKTGDELKTALHNIIKGHKVVSYAGLLDAFAYTDCDANHKIIDIYSNYHYNLSGNCGTYQKEGDCWNREHTWPQSWFKEKAGPKSDLFHVYPTDGYVNGRRSNYPYGEVNNPTYTSGNGSKLGPCVTNGYSGTVFEPIDEYKGDIARSYFYMSVRYFGEDSGWGSSGMTNKSVVKDWAMTMLLRWSDEDPVSQKEIDRNNAIYGYQNNRNPFIDHPEYAHMIWDSNYTPATSYGITYASGLSHGSVSGPDSAPQGSTVAIVATPAVGYMVDTYTVYKTGSPSTTVTVSSNGTFTMPGYAVTVRATFKPNTTTYQIAKASVTHGSINTSVSSATAGTEITLTATPASGYQLYAWYVYKTGDMNTTVTVTNNKFTMPAFDVTVNATFNSSSGTGDYVKVTSAPSDWSGEYLIVYEGGNKAFNGGLTTLDATNNNINVSISNNTIIANTNTNAAKFTIAKSGNNYTIKSASGYYIGCTSNDNDLMSSNTTAYSNSLSMSGDSTVIKSSGGAYLRFNDASDQNRFRYYKSSTYLKQKAIQLYKKQGGGAPTHKVYFNSNGGTGTMSDQTVEEYVPTALNPNTFTKSNHQFDGWNTAADGSGAYYVDGASVTLLQDLTLYAQWNPLYSVTVISSLANGTVTVSATQAFEEQTITLTATPAANYEFGHWLVTDANNNPITVVENQFEMPASDVTVNAAFEYVGTPFEQKYYKVTSTNQLVAGRTYLIVNTAAGKALSKTQNNNNRAAAAVTITNNTISTLGDACELTLGGQSGAWTFFDSLWSNSTGGYLYAASSGDNYLRTQATNNNNGKWAIELANNGTATIVAQGSYTRNNLRYNPNNNNPIFSCYASSSDFAKVELYIRSEEFDITENTTVTKTFSFDKYTVHNGATLTFPNNTVTFSSPANLVLEEGAQLVHHNDNLQATCKRTIQGYEGEGSWYTIASPFASYSPVGGMIGDNFDLYAYNEAGDDEGSEWINYKAGAFNLNPGEGYLYAHYPIVTLRMTGTLKSGDYSKIVNLSYDNPEEAIQGYNLLGNPTAHDITFSKSPEVSDGYYYLNNNDTWTYQTGNAVPVGRGFLVKANATGQTVTLNPQSKGEVSSEDPYLCIDINGEKAYVKLSEGVSMPLAKLNDRYSPLFLNREHTPYVMLVKDSDNTLDLCYEARQDGPATLSVSNLLPFTSHLSSPNYLHLIDRLTGADVDLLATPSYSFETRKGDYSARFQLCFSSVSSDTPQGDFAYYSNGQIVLDPVVVASCQGASLQMVDLLGRVRSLGTIDGANEVAVGRDALERASATTTGVYVLRLLNGDEVRTQKIVLY